MLHPLLLADAFGVREYPSIYGFSQLFMTAGVAFGPALVGLLRDGFNYGAAYSVAAATSVISATLFWFAGGIEQPAATDEVAAVEPIVVQNTVATPPLQ